VPPLKGGTFCFPRLTIDAVRANARIKPSRNLK
jgi:hypothetical protein